MLLYGDRSRSGRRRFHRDRRFRRHVDADVSSFSSRYRLSAAGSVHFRGLSVENNIKAVLEVVEKDRSKRASELDALLEEFHIAHLRKAPAISLSGGERRRLEIARALASRPNFMLLDEPFAGVDPIAVSDIQQLVRHLTSRGIGVLITDHNVRETLGLIDRAYIIHAGQVLTHGRPAEIVANPDVRRLYLGDQFTL